jgi:hypothetical protein
MKRRREVRRVMTPVFDLQVVDLKYLRRTADSLE